MIKIMAPAILAIALLAGGCGDDSDASPFGPGAEPDLEDVLGDLADGSFDEGDLSDLMNEAEQAAERLGNSGSGTVSINDDTIEFTSEICFSGQGDFTIEGPGTSADGSPVWVSINQTVDSRAEKLEYFDEAIVETLYGDADPIIESDITVDYGRTELFGDAPDDQPSFHATSGAGGDDLDMTSDGQSATGSGEAADFNFVAGDYSVKFPFTFTAGCS